MLQLHNDLALEAIDFTPTKPKLDYSDENNFSNPIAATQFFSINKLNLTKNYVRDLEQNDSFTIYMYLNGTVLIETDGFSEVIKKGEIV